MIVLDFHFGLPFRALRKSHIRKSSRGRGVGTRFFFAIEKGMPLRGQNRFGVCADEAEAGARTGGEVWGAVWMLRHGRSFSGRRVRGRCRIAGQGPPGLRAGTVLGMEQECKTSVSLSSGIFLF